MRTAGISTNHPTYRTDTRLDSIPGSIFSFAELCLSANNKRKIGELMGISPQQVLDFLDLSTFKELPTSTSNAETNKLLSEIRMRYEENCNLSVCDLFHVRIIPGNVCHTYFVCLVPPTDDLYEVVNKKGMDAVYLMLHRLITFAPIGATAREGLRAKYNCRASRIAVPEQELEITWNCEWEIKTNRKVPIPVPARHSNNTATFINVHNNNWNPEILYKTRKRKREKHGFGSSWLGQILAHAKNVPTWYIYWCEQVLVHECKLNTVLCFIKLPPDLINAEFLSSVGITARSAQERILTLHQILCAEFEAIIQTVSEIAMLVVVYVDLERCSVAAIMISWMVVLHATYKRYV